ncbi:MAG: HmuY family protein [Sphingobacterium sp.]
MNYKTKHLFICIIACLLGSSCSKSNDGPAEDIEDGISIVVRDLAGDVDASVGNSGPGKEKRDFHTFLFRFSDQKQTWLKNKTDSNAIFPSTDWDLAFTNNYNSTIYVNNGDQKDVPWTANGSQHKIVLLKKSYDLVDTAPSDTEFDNSELNGVGMILDERSSGWYNYNIVSHLVQVMPNRTYALRLSNGRYAKLQIINIYKGNPPAVTDLNWPAPYFTFKYFVQQDGSKNLKTK